MELVHERLEQVLQPFRRRCAEPHFTDGAGVVLIGKSVLAANAKLAHDVRVVRPFNSASRQLSETLEENLPRLDATQKGPERSFVGFELPTEPTVSDRPQLVD